MSGKPDNSFLHKKPSGRGALRIRKIYPAEFHDHALELARDRKLVTTIGGRAKFEVSIADDGHVYTPQSTGKARGHRWDFVERVLDTYNREATLNTSLYRYTVNASYQLAIIRDLLQYGPRDPGKSIRREIVPCLTDVLLRAPPAKALYGGEGCRGQRHSRDAKFVGDAGENMVMSYLHANSRAEGWTDIRHVAAEGRKPGWDIELKDRGGNLVAIEVKSTVAGDFVGFEVTDNELEQATRLGEHYWVVLVARVLTNAPEIQFLRNIAHLSSAGALRVHPTRYRVARVPR